MANIVGGTYPEANIFFGRRDIYSTTDTIDESNIIEQINTALSFHCQNLFEEEYLYWHRRGLQPILGRKKEIRPEICSKVVENHSTEIVDFKNGYFLTQPAFYISRNTDANEKVKELNEYLYRSGKQIADNLTVDWFHTVGKGAIYVKPNDSNDVPITVYSLDPRSAFVVYSLQPGHEPVMGVNMVVVDDLIKIDAFTKDKVYRLSGTVGGRFITSDPVYIATATSIEAVEPNVIGEIPIIEYRYNSVNMGSFESVLPLLDALNDVMSNRCDGVAQFIQSLVVMYNCQLPEGEDGNTIRQQGLIALKSIGENKADIKVLSEELDQTQTQVLVDYLYQQILTICGMPCTVRNGKGVSDTTGAAILANNGWYQADTVARNTEDLFKASNKYFDRILLKVLKTRGLLDLKETDFELHFVRNETANIQSKAQAFSTLLSAGLNPELAAAKSGVSNDPVSDIAASEKYLKMIWGDPDKLENSGKGEAKIIEEDNFIGNNDVGGAV